MSSEALVTAILRLYRGHCGEGQALLAAATPVLARLLAQPPGPVTAIRKPACRFLAAAMAAGACGPLAGVAHALAAVERKLPWVQNPNYTPETIGKAFLDRYAYSEIAGPAGLLSSRRIAVGFLLLGPNTHYPDHHHPAAEVYHVVSGRAEWRRAGNGWQERPAGAAIHHPSNVRHAMRTRNEPLLALYCWLGQIATAARLAAQPMERTGQ